MMKKTLIAAVVTVTTLSGSAVAWTEGAFNSTLDVGGTITPDLSGWKWKLGSSQLNAINLNAADGVVDSNNNIVWSHLGTTMTVLTGRTITRSIGVSGLAPVINYGGDGFTFSDTDPAAPPLITLTAKGISEPTKTGSISFNMDMFSIATTDYSSGIKSVQAVMGAENAYGNGYLQNSSYYSMFTTAHIIKNIATEMGSDMINTIDYRAGPNTTASIFVNNQSVEGAYLSKIVGGSVKVAFPNDAIPSDWKSAMNVSVSYL